MKNRISEFVDGMGKLGKERVFGCTAAMISYSSDSPFYQTPPTTVEEALKGLEAAGGGNVDSFAKLQNALRNGTIGDVLEVGDQIKVNKATAVSAAVTGTGVTAATVDLQTFIEKIGKAETNTYEFVYDGAAWNFINESGNRVPVTLSQYGITPTGTAAAEDIIAVSETASEIVFDVVGIDYDVPSDSRFSHSLSLLTRDIQTYGTIPFSQPQALKAIAADEFPSGLAAGNYYFTLDHGAYNSSTGQDGIYGFALTQPVPVGGKIRHTTIGKLYTSSANYTQEKIVEGTFTTYDADYNVIESGIATTLLETATGMNLGTCTAEDMSYMVGSHLNSTRRQLYGSNYAAASATYKWLNSKAAGAASGQIASWWTASDEFDMPIKSTLAGFLHGMDPGFVATLGKVLKRTAVSAWDNGGTAGYKDTEELAWLPSMTELDCGNNGTVVETSPNADGTVTGTGPYDFYIDSVNADRVKQQGSTVKTWQIRSPYPSVCMGMRYIGTSGSISSSYGNAIDTRWIVAGLCIV